MMRFRHGTVRHLRALLVLVASCGWVSHGWGQPEPGKWEKEIAAFEATDRAQPPPTNAILFVGSSSIRLWKTLARDFQKWPVINRGFGGSEMADSLHFADRIVLPYRPRQVVVYAGDNDLANGKSPERVFADYRAFVEEIRKHLPGIRIAYVAIKPSPSRWGLEAEIRTANRLIAEYSRSDKRLEFIDIFTPMLDSQGRPREELFLPDKLHVNADGYELWTKLIQPHLK